ncbi:hypothetical protein GOV09_00595, partial [Candidatus Woesearchaeota archaeon]|nr:hypothetical protein [Candidatus Woesearchaeota archaeon]
GNAYAEDIKRLEVIPIESCYDVKMENSRTHRVLYETSIIPITLIHEGTKEAIYTVVKEGEEWISIDADQFTLKPGERFAFNVIAQPGNVSEDNYYVNLKMQTSAVEYKKVLKLKLREDESFLHKTGDYISLNRYWIYSGILVLILVVILLTYLRNKAKVWKIRKLIYRARKEEVKKKAVKKTKKAVKKKKREPTNWKVIIIGGIIAVVLGLLATYTPYLTIFWGAIVSAAIEYGLYVIIGVLILIILLAILNKVEE